MNAVFLTIIALVAGMPVEAIDAFATMEECLAAANAVITMENVIAADCAWFEAEAENWRLAFGEKI